jgi:ABC-type transport system involved in cytochrome bd biosynthesis fused ATPase/permease subunit
VVFLLWLFFGALADCAVVGSLAPPWRVGMVLLFLAGCLCFLSIRCALVLWSLWFLLMMMIFSHSRVVRKSIARVLTVMAQSRKAALNDKFSGAKYKPTDLRFRKTRAKRRALTSNQRGQRTVREAKRAAHFPRTRVFALKA